MAIAGLVLGIIALVLCWVPFVNWILALLGGIFGAVGMVKGKRVGRGRGAAITGLVLSVVAVAISVVLWYLAAQAAKSELDKIDLDSKAPALVEQTRA